jgi:hypothetical protein
MKINHRERPSAPAKDNGRGLRENICDSATNSFLPVFSCPEIPRTTAKSLEAPFDRRVFLMAMVAAPLGLVSRTPKRPQVRGVHMTAMFARRV